MALPPLACHLVTRPVPETITITPIQATDRPWVRRFVRERWGSEQMVAHGDVFYPAEHEGFIARLDGKAGGLATYRIAGEACEITLIDSGINHRGIGTALLQAVQRAARGAGCRRLWLVTTNDNLDALRFYQRRGFVLSALRPNAVASARQLKPEIPEIGDDGIPLRDELELEMPLG